MAPTATKTVQCRMCGSKRLAGILSLGNQHVSDFVSETGGAPKSPLELVICRQCNLVQLKHTFPRDSLYRYYWYRSGISSTMRSALTDITQRVSEVVKPRAGDVVIDIGCNDGTLLRSYDMPGLRLVGFEPAKNIVEEARKGTELIFNDYFSQKLFAENYHGLKARVITSIAMFYDLDDPNTFVSDVSKSLDRAGVWVVQQNYLPLMLERNGYDNIGHEHLAYYSLETMTTLLKKHSLRIFHVETNDVNGGSFRTLISHEGVFPIDNTVKTMEVYERRLFDKKPSIYTRFGRNVGKQRMLLEQFVRKEVKAGKTIYVYGASTRGNTILQYCHLDRRLIAKGTDANPAKWGLETPGTRIPIVSKEEARSDHPDYFLILPHHFLEEIREEEKDYLSSGGNFIVPLPQFRVIKGSKVVAPKLRTGGQ